MIRKGDVVIDIGANLGYYSLLFAGWVGSSGKVYAVEPVRIYNRIFEEKTCRHHNITLYPYALGLEEKSVTLVSSPHSGYLKTGLPHVYDEETDGTIDDAEFYFEAQMKRPSELFGGMTRIDYIKCDVEGYEFTVLSEMKNLIEIHKPKVQVEIWSKNIKPLSCMFEDMGYTGYRLVNNSLIPLDEAPEESTGDYLFIHQHHQQIKNI